MTLWVVHCLKCSFFEETEERHRGRALAGSHRKKHPGHSCKVEPIGEYTQAVHPWDKAMRAAGEQRKRRGPGRAERQSRMQAWLKTRKL